MSIRDQTPHPEMARVGLVEPRRRIPCLFGRLVVGLFDRPVDRATSMPRQIMFMLYNVGFDLLFGGTCSPVYLSPLLLGAPPEVCCRWLECHRIRGEPRRCSQ